MATTVSIKGRMVLSAVGAGGREGRTAVKNMLKVAAAGACGIRASVLRSGVIEEAQRADAVLGRTLRGDVAEARAVSVLSIVVGGVCPLDCSEPGQPSDRGSHSGNLTGVN